MPCTDDMTTTTTTAKGKVKGEGRIISLNDKFGFLGAQGIKSKVFIIPSSLKADPPFPKLSDVLEVDDIVHFEAVEQPERNGAKYVAVDGSVKVKQRGKDVMYEGDGKVVQLDKNRGYFGFIEADVGNVFFNISAVRPSTNDVTKVLKVGQKVKFRCLPNSEQPNCKWRASLVVPMSKVNEFMRPPPPPPPQHHPTQVHHNHHQQQQQQPISMNKTIVSPTITNGEDSRPKSTSFSSDYGSGPASPLMFNNNNVIGSSTTTVATTNGYRTSQLGSISPPMVTTTNGFGNNQQANTDAWSSTRSSTRYSNSTASDGEMGSVNEMKLSSPTGQKEKSAAKVNASAMWDTFLQQQQALSTSLWPWMGEGRENFYSTPPPPSSNGYHHHQHPHPHHYHHHNLLGNNALNRSLFHDSSDFPFENGTQGSTTIKSNGHIGGRNSSTSSSSTTSSSLFNNSNNYLNNSVGDSSSLNSSLDEGSSNSTNGDVSSTIGGRQQYESSICSQMVKLAHELNGWKDDGCPFCCNNKSY